MQKEATEGMTAQPERRRVWLLVVGACLVLYGIVAVATRTDIKSTTTTTFNPDYDPDDFTSGHVEVSSTTVERSMMFPTDGIIAGGIGLVVLLVVLRGKAGSPDEDDGTEPVEPESMEEPSICEPYRRPEELIQEDPDFQKWREDHPDIQDRRLVDQIALYRDFQNGC